MSQSVHYEPLDVRQCWGLLFLPPVSLNQLFGADGVELVLNGRRAFRDYRLRTQRCAVLVAHRRCGKTVACVQGRIDRSTTLTLPHGRYAYVGPYLSQAQETAWEYLKRFAQP